MQKRIIALLCLLFSALATQAQTTDIVGDELNGFKVNGEAVRQFKGNVSVKQPGKTMYCDLLNSYADSKKIEAFGNVRIVQDDGTVATGDTLYFLETNQLANLRGNVTLNDKGKILTTRALDYHMNSGTAYYYSGAKIVDGKNTLVSQQGEYNRATQILTFKKNVRMSSENYTLDTDTLRYNTQTKISYFSGPTKIVTADGTLFSNKGSYDTNTEVATFEGRSTVNTPDYLLISDYSNYDKQKDQGFAQGNVVMFSKKDSITILGAEAIYSKSKGYTKMYGNVLMKSPSENKDTLYLAADTLLSLGSNDPKTQKTTASKLFAYKNVKIFKSDMQAVCDSLVYNFTDSTIYFFRNPILWNGVSQITGDSIWMLQRNNKPHQMYIRQNAFIVSRDSLKNYNQVKGRNMLASFVNSQIQKINVNGNGQSLYFALEGDTALQGMNRANCSDMIVRFKEKNRLKTITFLNKPEASFIPPHELPEPDKYLKGFKWHAKIRPTKAMVLGSRFVKPAVKASVKPKTTKMVTKPTKKAKKPNKVKTK